MPGQWQMSLQQITDADGRLINGALAYFYEAETERSEDALCRILACDAADEPGRGGLGPLAVGVAG